MAITLEWLDRFGQCLDWLIRIGNIRTFWFCNIWVASLRAAWVIKY